MVLSCVLHALLMLCTSLIPYKLLFLIISLILKSFCFDFKPSYSKIEVLSLKTSPDSSGWAD